MRKYFFRRLVAKSSLLLGILFTVVGGSLLLASVSGASRVLSLASSFLVCAGVLFVALAAHLHRRSRYIFMAAFLILTGAFLLLAGNSAREMDLLRAWPLISVFAGLSLLPAGWHRYRALKSNYLVPSIAFVALGSVLLVFSFNLVASSLKRFVLDWWMVLMVLAGALLLLISLAAKDSGSDDSEESGS